MKFIKPYIKYKQILESQEYINSLLDTVSSEEKKCITEIIKLYGYDFINSILYLIEDDIEIGNNLCGLSKELHNLAYDNIIQKIKLRYKNDENILKYLKFLDKKNITYLQISYLYNLLNRNKEITVQDLLKIIKSNKNDYSTQHSSKKLFYLIEFLKYKYLYKIKNLDKEFEIIDKGDFGTIFKLNNNLILKIEILEGLFNKNASDTKYKLYKKLIKNPIKGIVKIYDVILISKYVYDNNSYLCTIMNKLDNTSQKYKETINQLYKMHNLLIEIFKIYKIELSKHNRPFFELFNIIINDDTKLLNTIINEINKKKLNINIFNELLIIIKNLIKNNIFWRDIWYNQFCLDINGKLTAIDIDTIDYNF